MSQYNRRNGFVLSNEPRNIVNNYELNQLINDLIVSYPEFERYIKLNIRNFFIKKFPCISIKEEEAHRLYSEFYKINLHKKIILNPEVVIVKNKSIFEYHQLLVSHVILNKIRNLLDYFRIFNINPKDNLNVVDIVKKSEIWHKKIQHSKEIIEGETIEVMKIKEGLRVVQLKDFQSFTRESIFMKNCVRTYYQSSLSNKCKIYSLRNNENKPLVTIEIQHGVLIQSKCVGNSDSIQYSSEIEIFLSFIGAKKVKNMIDYYEGINTMIGTLPYNSNNSTHYENSFIRKIKNFYVRLSFFIWSFFQ